MRILLFIIIYLAIYGSAHYFFFWKARSAWPWGNIAAWALASFLGVMILAPVLALVAEKSKLDILGRPLALLGYTWMGVLFLWLTVYLALNLCQWLFRLAELLLGRDLSFLRLSSPGMFQIALLLALGLSIYGYFEARNIRLEKIKITTSKIPVTTGPVRLVQLSDIHLGLIVQKARLKRILDVVKKADPDIIVSTGDLVDAQLDGCEDLAAWLKEIRPRYGKFAVTGNHEYFPGLAHSLEFTKNAGFEILRGEGVTVAGRINIAGVDDPLEKYLGENRKISEKDILSKLPREKFTILLKHRPVVNHNALGLFDLQLSGHAHKGQIFPFSLLTRMLFRYHAGFYPLANNAAIYVSPGTGTWGPPMRLLARPEVTLIELVPKE